MTSRGILDLVRVNEEQPLEVSFSFVWDYITGYTGSGGLPTIEDALKKRADASTWISTNPDTAAPYSVDILVEYVPPCVGPGVTETIVLPMFKHEQLAHSLRDASIACTGRCNVIQALSSRS